MPEPKPHPTGNKLIRLADIPIEQRRAAALKLMRETSDTSEYAALFELVVAPGNRSARIAA